MFESLAAKAIAGLVAALVIFGAGSYAGYRWEHGVLADYQAAAAHAQFEAVQVALAKQQTIDDMNMAAAMSEAQKQQQIVTVTKTITKEIPRYVNDQTNCVSGLTVGLARVLRAAAVGADPASLQLASGQSDDTCSDVTPSEVAGWFTDYAGESRANAEQLDALIAAVNANAKVATSAAIK